MPDIDPINPLTVEQFAKIRHAIEKRLSDYREDHAKCWAECQVLSENQQYEESRKKLMEAVRFSGAMQALREIIPFLRWEV